MTSPTLFLGAKQAFLRVGSDRAETDVHKINDKAADPHRKSDHNLSTERRTGKFGENKEQIDLAEDKIVSTVY